MKTARKIVNFIKERYDSGIMLMPYCIGMWDSMESIYQEAKKQKIPIGVMPVPYCGRKKNGKVNLEDIKYEFDLFKNYVDEGDLIDYNLLKPGVELCKVAIINYPYNHNNFVTTIHPDFFTGNLIKLGYDVVYVPYSPYSTEEMRYQSAIWDSKYIFVYDEAEKQRYIETFAKEGLTIKDKIVVVGTPKTDNLISKKENKIVLVCNSIIPFINNPEEKIKKYREIIIRERKKGNFVIFRPHPLMKQTIKALKPKIKPIYDSFLTEVKSLCPISENSLTDALNMADELITDQSGIICLWKETHKKYEIM